MNKLLFLIRLLPFFVQIFHYFISKKRKKQIYLNKIMKLREHIRLNFQKINTF